MIRETVFRLHLSVAVVAGAVILMMAATGVVLSLEETVTGLAERRYFVDAAYGEPRLAPEEIAAAVAFEATSLQYRAHPRAPVRVHEGRDRYAYVDPYSGDVLGHGPGGLEGFFEGVHNWHRWFNVSDGSVRRARAVTGAVNVAFVFLLLTGPVLWIPRRLTRKALGNALLLRPGAKGAWRDLSWHQVVGIWSAVPLLAIAASGVTTSYPAVGDRVYPVVGAAVPVEAWPGRARRRSAKWRPAWNGCGPGEARSGAGPVRRRSGLGRRAGSRPRDCRGMGAGVANPDADAAAGWKPRGPGRGAGGPCGAAPEDWLSHR